MRDLRQMLAAIEHRGPDGIGSFIDNNLALGHCRLAIIDLDGGTQPRIDDSTGDALSFNGEIYGYRTLADGLRCDGITLRDDSDTEVLFQLIRRYGVRDAVERIDGMFAFAFRDGVTGELHLVRDRFGEKPLYYGIAAGQLVFGSEAGAVLCHSAFRYAAPDLAAAYQFLQFEYLPGCASGWTGIKRLAPGTILRFRAGRVMLDRYWRPQVGTNPSVQEAEAVNQLNDLLQNAVRREVVADVPVGVLLSGGLDSSLLTALAMRAAPDISAFTVRVEGQGFDESRYAIDVARHLGIRHEVVGLSGADMAGALDALGAHLSEPLADSSLLPTWLVCRAAKRHMTVALGGDGADELFAGYPNFTAQRLAGLMRTLPPATGAALARVAAAVPWRDGYMSLPFLLTQLSQGFGQPTARQSFHWMAPFASADMHSIWAADVAQEGLRTTAFAEVDAAAAEAGAVGLDRLLHQFLVTYLPGNILTKTDRAAMFNGLEVRSPFLSLAFAEYACALPGRLKLRGNTRKHILKQVARRYLPERIVGRRKHGFAAPISSLLRTAFRERCEDVLLSGSNPVSPWFDRARLGQLVQEHMSGVRDHGKRLWALYVLFTVAARYAPRPVAGLLGVAVHRSC